MLPAINTCMARATKLRVILSEIRTRLINQNIYLSNQVYIGRQKENAILTPTVDYCIITPGRQQKDDAETFVMRGSVVLTLFNHNLLDEGDRANSQITSSTLGLLRKADEIAESLELHDLQSSSVPLLVEPMRLKSVSEAKTDRSERWMKTELEFEICWEWDIS